MAVYLETKLQEARKYYADREYIAIGIDVDHAHLHMVVPPKYAVSTVVETLKKNTSRELKRKRQDKRSVNFKSSAPVKARGVYGG